MKEKLHMCAHCWKEFKSFKKALKHYRKCKEIKKNKESE